jgi:hypothetical protein
MGIDVKLKIMVVAGAFVCATPAFADWQYTRWGMSSDEVITASKGSLKRGDGQKSAQNSDTRQATGSYVTGDLEFDANLWFGPDGLRTVSLSLRDDKKCQDIQRDLLGKYGTPVERSGGTVQRLMWADREANNRVALVTTGLGYCQLSYEPLISGSSSGL